MTPQQFIAKWGTPGGVAGPSYALNEEQGAQSHFLDLCELLGVPKPGSVDGYLFEEKNALIGGKTGYADVFLRGHFAWENKAPGKNLDTALKQLLNYSLALSNPPLLVVCDRLTIRIHTQFNGHPSEVHTVLLAELDQPDKQALLRQLWTNPERFRPKKTSRDITEAAAKSFATLADGLRKRNQDADEVAHFLTQCLFCFFAEDVGLLPGRMFEGLVNNKQLNSEKLTQGLTNLFTVMRKGGLYGNDDIPWFNGGLFKRVKVPRLSIMEMTELRNAAALNWSAIDVSIFGTLFERGLDPSKRSQLGAHYTDPATILRIIDPVLSRPLLQKWELIAQEVQGLMAKSKQKKRAAYSAGGRHYKASPGDASFQKAERLFHQWLTELNAYRVLDPACGSGNFLFMGLKALKDIEHKSHLDVAMFGLDREADLVTGPHNVLGIELNEYAAELARVTVWIGELQWRMAHGYEFKTNPVLEPLDHIECRDALLCFPANAHLVEKSEDARVEPGAQVVQTPGPHTLRFLKSAPTSAPPTPLDDVVVFEASWPKAHVVIGNPPFLGGSKKRRELGDDYFAALDSVFAGRVPGGADLVCYWFDKARVAIESHELEAAGLVATQAIRAGSNRAVLTAICETGRIFDTWSDEAWVNEGAAVRVSLVCFGVDPQPAQLNGQPVTEIHADLTGGIGLDLTLAKGLPENSNASFEGTKKYGDFDIPGDLAHQWLGLPNPHGLSNALVVKPWRNGQDLSRRPSDTWIVDFGTAMSEGDAALFEAPFTHVLRVVRPERLKVRRERTVRLWWLHEEARVSMRKALTALLRYIATPRVSKHRSFVFLDKSVLADTRLNVISRADDTTFGILSSRIHEVWSLAQASVHGDGTDGGRPTYNAKSCFETFPFPAGLTPADTAHQRTELLPDGSIIPADIYEQNGPVVLIKQAHETTNNIAIGDVDPKKPKVGLARMSGAASNGEAFRGPASEPTSPGESQLKSTATAIAQAAKKLNDLREAWLNPPEWTHKVPEVIPLGMDKSPYPDRVEPKPGISETDLKALQKRTLTNLYNAKPAWLQMAHQQLDQAVAAAYGWADYTPAMPDDEILKRLLALNLARSNEKLN